MRTLVVVASVHALVAPRLPTVRDVSLNADSRDELVVSLLQAKDANEIDTKLTQLGEIENDMMLSIAMSSYLRVDEPQKGLALFNDARQRGMEMSVNPYNVAIFSEKERWEEALSLLDEMQERGIAPTVATYNAAIVACEPEWERAVQLLGEIDNPNTNSYNAAMSACSRADQWERAVELLREMQDKGVTASATSYSAAMNACLKSERHDDVVALFNEMPQKGVAPNVIVYEITIEAYKALGQEEKANELFEAMEKLAPKK